MNVKTFCLAAVAATLFASPAFAHHSFAMFDTAQSVVLKGVVTEYEWTNPHCWLRMEAMDEASGVARQWAFEMSSPAVQASYGMTRDSVHSGDIVTVTFHPMRDGSRGGQFVQAILADGTEVARANRAGAPGPAVSPAGN